MLREIKHRLCQNTNCKIRKNIFDCSRQRWVCSPQRIFSRHHIAYISALNWAIAMSCGIHRNINSPIFHVFLRIQNAFCSYDFKPCFAVCNVHAMHVNESKRQLVVRVRVHLYFIQWQAFYKAISTCIPFACSNIRIFLMAIWLLTIMICLDHILRHE